MNLPTFSSSRPLLILQADIAFATLNATDVSTMNAHPFGETFLAKSCRCSLSADRLAERNLKIRPGHGRIVELR